MSHLRGLTLPDCTSGALDALGALHALGALSALSALSALRLSVVAVSKIHRQIRHH